MFRMGSLKSYSCEQCGNDYVSRTTLRYHFRVKHLGKVHCEKRGPEVVRETLQDHEAANHERMTAERQGCFWDMPPKREAKFVSMEMSTSCRMCPRKFGTIHSREHHEKQDHHFTASKRAQMATGFSPDNILDYKNPTELKTFVEEKLRPIPGPASIACATEIEAIINLIKECFPLPIARLIKGGSYIKGTDTQGWSDVDIVLFSEAFENLEDCKKKLPEVIDDLGKRLKKSSWASRIMMEKRTQSFLRFHFKCYKNHHGHSFDIMPCYDMLGPAPSTGLKQSFYHKIYLCNDTDEIQLYSMSLLQYQVEFIKASTMKVKDLIRLVKHWFRTSFAKPTAQNKFRRLPSSYAIELITISIWQLAGKPVFFSLIQGMRAILKLLVRYPEIYIVWHKHYSPNSTIFKKAFQKQTRPFVLDPAKPTFNVCENSNAWDEVAHVARLSLLKPLFNGVQAKEPWLFTNGW
ncbi:2'-5'-oligoadenylate synthase 1A-like isoform X1 [Gopherus flavomarginatus]|uniref:2'-5'-oligoadenylate synthase 1A-like isoform X1 n=2 Tax=Gopherus flavomarginatus TaxID=286002 RepID=UPI0021CBABCA|nr:2'-5'-oligoadenylate synthase 1A-like isoform X1 [Gopherus flavomarginatus]